MAKKQTSTNESNGEYRQKYFDLKFSTMEKGITEVNEKLDDVLSIVATKASSVCVHEIEKKVDRMDKDKIGRDEFAPVKKATEGAVYYGKHPQQLKMVIVGFFLMIIIYLVAVIPTCIAAIKGLKEIQKIEKVEIPK